MTGNLVVMKVNSWTRLHAFALAIEPNLMGRSHTFTHRGLQIELSLPDSSMLDRPSTHDQIAHRTSYRKTEDGEIPLEVCVHKIDVRIAVPETFQLPSAMLERPCCAHELISTEQQEQLFERTQSFGGIARDAYAYWLDAMRWVMRNGTLGRPQRVGLASGWGTYFEETVSRHRIWSERSIHTVERRDRMSEREWAAIERVVSAGISVPTYWLYLLESQQLLKDGDIRRCAIDGALALETFLRGELESAIPQDLPVRFKEVIRRSRLSELLSPKMAEPVFGRDVVSELGDTILADLRGLVESRNHLLHGGLTLPSESELYHWLDAVRCLIVVSERTRNRFSEIAFPR